MLKKQKKCTFSNKKKGMALSKRKKTMGIPPLETAVLRLPNPFQIGACTLAGTLKLKCIETIKIIWKVLSIFKN